MLLLARVATALVKPHVSNLLTFPAKRTFVLGLKLLRKETKTEASPVTSILKIVKKESSIQKLAPEDSPIKKTSRKRAVILDSDEGSQDSENKWVQ